MGNTMGKGMGKHAGLAAELLADESVMSKKAHGTAPNPVITSTSGKMRWDADAETADRICCFNRHYAEHSGYWLSTQFLKEHNGDKEVTFYDSVTGKPAFIAPRGRSWQEFVSESRDHGWPSFRDEEVVKEN